MQKKYTQNIKQIKKHKSNKKQKNKSQTNLNNKKDIEEIEDRNLTYEENTIKEILNIYEKFIEVDSFHTGILAENNSEEEELEEIEKIKQKINNEEKYLNIKINNNLII